MTRRIYPRSLSPDRGDSDGESAQPGGGRAAEPHSEGRDDGRPRRASRAQPCPSRAHPRARLHPAWEQGIGGVGVVVPTYPPYFPAQGVSDTRPGLVRVSGDASRLNLPYIWEIRPRCPLACKQGVSGSNPLSGFTFTARNPCTYGLFRASPGFGRFRPGATISARFRHPLDRRWTGGWPSGESAAPARTTPRPRLTRLPVSPHVERVLVVLVGAHGYAHHCATVALRERRYRSRKRSVSARSASARARSSSR